MSEHVIIDGNNLLFAMREHAPLPAVGRETLVRIIERWAAGRDHEVTLVFDGSAPLGGLLRQMASNRLSVRFSGSATADDVIVEMIHAATEPDGLRIISTDAAIRYEARLRRCRETTSDGFVGELYPESQPPKRAEPISNEKPTGPSAREAEEWLDRFGVAPGDDEPFDGFEAMRPNETEFD